MQYAANIINPTYIKEHYSEILQKYNINENNLSYTDQNIEDYSNMNDPIGNIGQQLGKEYLLEPNPIKAGESVTYSPHEYIEIFFDNTNIESAQEISEWSIKMAGALFCFDTNYSGVNVLYSFIKEKYSIDENDLKTAIDIIREKLQEPSKYLSYTTDNGTYIIDSKESSHVINATEKNDIVFANSGSDIVNGFSGNDILIGGEGEDTLYGGNGNDVLIAGDISVPIGTLEQLHNKRGNITSLQQYETKYGGTNQLYGGEGDDLLIGDKGNDYLSGGSGHDYIYGGDGNDILVAGSGTDYLYGGSGNDVLCNYEDYGYLNGGPGYDNYNISRGSTNELKDDKNGEGAVHLDGLTLNGASKDYYKGGK